VHYKLKTPWRDGTTHAIFEPLDFIASLAALVPKPRVNLTRFHGVFAPNSKHRAQMTPARRGKVRSASTVAGRCYRYFGKADVQMPVFTFTEGPQVAESRLMHCNKTSPCSVADTEQVADDQARVGVVHRIRPASFM
jgi:hypothetical protein